MASTPEQLRGKVPPLEYGDLVNMDRVSYGLSPILGPEEIPIHPSVFKSPQFFTTEFAQMVWNEVPGSIIKDVSSIAAKAGPQVPVRVTEEAVHLLVANGGHVNEEDVQYFGRFIVGSDSPGQNVGIEPVTNANAVNVWIDRKRPKLTSLPIPKYIEGAYEVNPDEFNNSEGILTWYAHNIGDANLPLELILRNFAIMFNNLGLQELGI